MSYTTSTQLNPFWILRHSADKAIKSNPDKFISIELSNGSILEAIANIIQAYKACIYTNAISNDVSKTNIRLAVFRCYYAMFFNYLSEKQYIDLEADLLQFIVTDRALLDQCEIQTTDDGYAIYGNIDMEERLNTYRELVANVNERELAEMVVLLLKFVDNEFERLSA